jgi:hypothetical protein
VSLAAQSNQLYTELLNLIETYKEVAKPIQAELLQLQTDAELQLKSGEISLIDFIQLQEYQLALQSELLQWQHQIKLVHISYEWIQN